MTLRPWTLQPWALALWLAAVTAIGCAPQPASEPVKTPPAKVAQPAHEEELATITLTPEAEKRLAVFAVEVAEKPVARKRTLGGEVIALPGQAVTVAAPVAGVIALANNRPAVPGARVHQGDPIYTLLPLTSSEPSVLTAAEKVQMAQALASLDTLRAESRQQVELAKIQVEAAKKTLARAEQLFRDQAGSQQAVDEAKADFDVAQKTLETAQERLALLEKTRLDVDTGRLTPLSIAAPVTGVLGRLGAVPGELVVAGASLFEVIGYDRVWVRVPVFAGQWSQVDKVREALVSELGQPLQAAARAARPVPAPPSADPAAATIDLFYELENQDGRLCPGQKVNVTLSLAGEEKSLVVPWAAVLHDVQGGTWVYEQTAPQTFIRRRVHVRFVSGSDAVLAAGPKPGARVVTDGAAELFGTEFGFGK